MADTKITALAAITTVDPAADVLPIVDISDTSMAASGTTKKITSNQILGAGGTATLASATITGDLTVDTSTLKVDSTNDRVGIGTTNTFKPLTVQAGSTGSATINQGLVINSSAAYGVGQGVSYSSLVFSRNRSIDTASLTASVEIYGGNAAETSSNGGSLGFRTQNSAGTLTDRYTIDNTGVSTWSVGGSTAMTLNSTGLNVANGNVILGTSGKGIDFSATASGSGTMTSELLNDYEEGTWTATLKGTVSDPTTPVTATGRYTKIGRVVSVQVFFSGVTTTGASGRIQIDGLPFANNSSLTSIGSVGFNGMATFTGVPFASLAASSTTIIMFSSNSASSYAAVNFNTGTSQDLWASLNYTVA